MDILLCSVFFKYIEVSMGEVGDGDGDKAATLTQPHTRKNINLLFADLTRCFLFFTRQQSL